MKQIVIIGNGISGITCARNARKKCNDKITVISSETEHFFSRTALMYVYMGHMKYEHTKPYEDFFWEKNKIDLVYNYVARVDVKQKNIELADGRKVSYDILVIACGSRSNIPDIHGKDLKGIHTLYNYSDLEKIEAGTKNIDRAVISGGGLIGIEMAEMLISRNIHVTIVVREPTYWGSILSEEEGKLIGRHINEHKIELLLNTEMSEIIGDEHGNVKEVKTKSGQIIACQFVGLTIGVNPNVAFLKDNGIELDKGVLVNEFFETNVDDVYAIGDCAQFKEPLPGRKPIEQIWYTGRMHGETLAKTLTGKRTAYNPGPAFNSAKFLDIEYQTYGATPVKKEDNIGTFYWEHKNGKIAVTIQYDKNSNTLLGINTFGIRLRHNVMEAWLLEKRNIEHVLTHLADANFDPEFFRNYEHLIIQEYNIKNNKHLVAQKRSWNRLLEIIKF